MYKYNIIICLFLLTAIFSYSESLDEKIDIFWNTIKSNENTYYEMEPNDQYYWNEIYTAINKVEYGLGLLIVSELVNGKMEIVITSGGNIQLFDIVEQIVDRAPDLELFRVTAFLPRLTEFLHPYIIQDVSISVDEVRVHYDKPVNGKYHIMFIIPPEDIAVINSNKSGNYYHIYMNLLFRMTTDVLGEKLLGQRIVGGDVYLVNVMTPSIPISELYEAFK